MESISSRTAPRLRLPSGVKSAELSFLALQILLLLLTRLAQSRVYSDDAYIHFRNALNWIRGEGLLFNSGEWVLATTSPVFALMLAWLGSVLPAGIPSIAQGFNLSCEIVSLLLLSRLLSRAGLSRGVRHLLMAITSFEPNRMFHSTAGMEMSFFILAMLAVLDRLAAGRWLASGLILGVLPWIRPEGAVVWCAFGLALLLCREWRTFVRTYATAGVVAVLFCASLLVTYGTFVPLSVRIKSVAPWFAGSAGGGCALEFFLALGRLVPLDPFTRFDADYGEARNLAVSILFSLLQIVLIVEGARVMARSGDRLSALAMSFFVAGYYALYALANPQIFRWYYVPYSFFILTLAVQGWVSAIDGGLRWLARRAEWSEPRVKLRRAAALAALAFLFLLNLSRAAWSSGFFDFSPGWRGYAFRYWGPGAWKREYLYELSAQYLNDRIGGDSYVTVALPEIGVFGYGFKGRVLDVYGLVSPEVLQVIQPDVASQYRKQGLKFPFDVYLHLRPEFIVTMKLFFPDPPPAFLAAYGGFTFGDSALLIYGRKDVLDRYARIPDPNPRKRLQ